MNMFNVTERTWGFRFLDKVKTMGPFAYSEESFLRSLKIHKNLKIGVMVNAIDFLQSDLSKKEISRKLFPQTKNTKVKFVRLAISEGIAPFSWLPTKLKLVNCVKLPI